MSFEARLACWIIGIWLGVVILPAVLVSCVAHAEPVASLPYKRALIREAQAEWGLKAPIAVFAGQIEQESAWRPAVCSPYACGLAQFTASTARWMASRNPDLASGDVFNTEWALRALVRYDRDLYNQLGDSATNWDRWAFTLSAYNGGLGNVRRDQRLCLGPACRANRWSDVAPRSQRSSSNLRENRGYVDTILRRRQFSYASWGSTVNVPLAS